MVITIAPKVIKRSAKLNTKKEKFSIRRCKKSVTDPLNILSKRFPNPPERINIKPYLRAGDSDFLNSFIINNSAVIIIIIKITFIISLDELSKLNAIPVLLVTRRSINGKRVMESDIKFET